MNNLSKIKLYLNDPSQAIRYLMGRGFFNWMDDERYLKFRYRITMKKPLDLKHPRTYNEKLQWLKLYDRNPDYVRMVDKYEVKQYVASIIGEEYIIPTLGAWDRFDEIDFTGLPNQFVLKCTHDSGGLVICRDKTRLDFPAAKEKLEKSRRQNYFWSGREWPYKNVRPRIIAEQYMEDSQDRELRDYKFFMFDGEARALFIASDRGSATEETKFDFYDMEFRHLNFVNGHPNASSPPRRPEAFETMKHLAEQLSKGIPHVRVDFYEVDGKIYFGELTFFHWSGLVPFHPESWDLTFGEWIKLPASTRT